MRAIQHAGKGGRYIDQPLVRGGIVVSEYDMIRESKLFTSLWLTDTVIKTHQSICRGPPRLLRNQDPNMLPKEYLSPLFFYSFSILTLFLSDPIWPMSVLFLSLPALFCPFLYSVLVYIITTCRKGLTRVSECGEFVMRVTQDALMAEWMSTLWN